MAAALDTAWVQGSHGQLAVTIWRPTNLEVISVAVIAPPFAEELNKCRRMFALLGQSLASMGIATLLPDLYGTGDSQGEFGDATWTIWKDDIRRTIQWSRDTVAPDVDVIGVRAGALLALESVSPDAARALVLWTPARDGRTHLTQFFRVDVASAATGGGGGKTSTSQLWRELEGGNPVEVAGYEIAPNLALPMAKAELVAPLSGWSGRVKYIDVVAEGQSSSVASRSVLAALSAGSVQLDFDLVHGPPFWTTTEIALAPRAVESTCEFLSERPQRV